ncbi:MAG: hypothetical protein AAGL66_16640, partial [Pseudomonadota bacterium]
ISLFDDVAGDIGLADTRVEEGNPRSLGPAQLAAPAAVPLPQQMQEYSELPLYAVGSGLEFGDHNVPGLERLAGSWPEVLPEAEDMLDPALALLAAGEGLPAEAAVPDYVQQRIGWKTLAEQGRRA